MKSAQVTTGLSVAVFLCIYFASVSRCAGAAPALLPDCQSLDTAISKVEEAYQACANGGVSSEVLHCLRLSADALIQFLRDENMQCYYPDVVGSALGYRFGSCAHLVKGRGPSSRMLSLRKEEDDENLLKKNDSGHQSCSGSCWFCCYLRQTYAVAAQSCFDACN